MRESLGREGFTFVFHWVFLAKYLPRFPTIHNLDFVRLDKEKRGSAIQIFNTFCERLGGTVCYSFAVFVIVGQSVMEAFSGKKVTKRCRLFVQVAGTDGSVNSSNNSFASLSHALRVTDLFRMCLSNH
jgi:hypothetical protein